MKKLLIALLLLLSRSTDAQIRPVGCILIDYNGYLSQVPAIAGYHYFSPSGLTDTEQLQTNARVAELFKDFDVQVTSSKAIFYSYPTNKRAQVVVSANWIYGFGGMSNINALTLNDTVPAAVDVNGFTDPYGIVVPRFLGEAITHEIGHLLGLEHQSIWLVGKKIEEYNTGGPYAAPIMGVSYWSTRAVWWKGINSDGYYQDDGYQISLTWPRKAILW